MEIPLALTFSIRLIWSEVPKTKTSNIYIDFEPDSLLTYGILNNPMNQPWHLSFLYAAQSRPNTEDSSGRVFEKGKI